MVSSNKKKIVSAFLALSMIGTMVAAVPFSASADTTTTTTATPGVSYSAYQQTFGWQPTQTNGATTGAIGHAKRIEAFKIALTNAPAGASIQYQAHLQTYGWKTPIFKDGATAGTMGQSRRVEAIKVTVSGLTGYSVKYRVYQQTFGWQPWQTTANGTDIANAVASGATGHAKRVEAFQVELVNNTPNTQSEPLAVSSVAATSATAFTVTFNRAPDDTSAVGFSVKNASGTALSTTTTWNSGNTSATLSAAASIAPDTYTIAVTNGSTSLGSSTVTVSSQKIAKIVITATKLGVTSGGTTSGTKGFATYRVYDQYNNDITTNGIASSLQFTTGVTGSTTGKNGVVTIDTSTTAGGNGTNLLTYQSVVLTIYDSNTGVSASATLSTTSVLGTLSNFALGTALTNANNATLTADSPSTIFYLPYTATDVSGNATTSFDLIYNGLIPYATTSDALELTTSDPTDLTAKLIHDPSNYANAVIEVYSKNTTIPADLPIVIYAMTYSGTTSQISVTLHRQSTLYSLTLSAPTDVVAQNEGPVIPFTAVDQNGKTLTKATDILPNVTFSSNILTDTDSNGNLVLTLKKSATANTGTVTLTATTSSSGKYSSINITVVKTAYPDEISVASSFVTQFGVRAGATTTENIDAGSDSGNNYGGLTVLDQYGRAYNLSNKTDANGKQQYVVEVTSTSSSLGSTPVATVTPEGNSGTLSGTTPTNPYISGQGYFTIQAAPGTTVNLGTQNITFSLVDVSTGTVEASTTATINTVDNSSVSSYAIDSVSNAIYAHAAHATSWSGLTPYEQSYNANPSVYAKDSAGNEILLPDYSVTGVYSSDSSDFATWSDADYVGSANNDVKIAAVKPSDSTTTSASTTLTVALTGLDGKTKAVSTAVTSSTAAPVASSIAFVTKDYNGSNISWDSNTETVTIASGATFNGIAKYFADGSASSQTAYFALTDQYGKTSAAPVQISYTNTAGSTISFSSDGRYTSGTGTATVTAVAASGLTYTVTVVIE